MRSRSARPESPRDSPRDDERALVAPNPPSRRFALGDAMVVIAMIACLCAFHSRGVMFTRIEMYVRNVPSAVRYLYFDGPLPALYPNGPASYVREFVWWTPLTTIREIGLSLLLFGTPAVLVIRLRKPRPAWGNLVRQPGAVACLSVVAAFLLLVDLVWLGVSIPNPPLLSPGTVVAVCWAALLLSRQWRSEAGWVDRLGRVVGFGWLVEWLIEFVEMRR